VPGKSCDDKEHAVELDIKGKVALVNGAASEKGIGSAIARALAREGVRLVLTDVLQEGVDSLATELGQQGKEALAIGADQTRHDEVRSVVENATDCFGSIDILVNCAALTSNLGSVASMDPERWRRELDVSLTGPYLWSREVIPLMRKKNWGRIVNISSTNAVTGQPGVPGYVAAKGGLNSLTRQVAREQASRGITCNALVLGPIHTGIYDRGVFDEETVQRMMERVPLGRMGTPEEVAQLATFICSPLSGFMTGELITFDGGMTLGR
jgi:NAD(P)-dependent dehydrogenase (short-subunit alcohol dehydrogenase family)